jgi:hypothetical protein
MTGTKSSFIGVAIFLIANLVMATANASLLIEPHLGYNITGNAGYDPNTTTYNGFQYGARLGAQLNGIMGGLDFNHSTFTYETTISGVTSINDDKRRDQYAVFVGYNFPSSIRAWISYCFLDKLNQTSTGAHGTPGAWSQGTGVELGVGILAIPYVSFNINYHITDYDKDNGTALKHRSTSRELVIGISTPFTIL